MRAAKLWLLPALLLLVAGECQELHAPHCKLECQTDGKCTGQGEQCIATAKDDCLRSEACEQAGRCSLRGQVCVATPESCQKLPECKARGACSPNQDGYCVAVSDADCKDSEGCKTKGLCSVDRDNCTAKGDDCKTTPECQEFGRCTAKAGHCVIASDADCAQSKMCTENGYCSFSKGRCLLLSPEDCAKTVACRVWGRCTYDKLLTSGALPQYGCVVGSHEDCQGSENCKKHKLCYENRGECASHPYVPNPKKKKPWED